jgi:hypothetical protein
MRTPLGKGGRRLDYPHNVHIHVSALTDTQEINELRPRGHEEVHLEDLGVHTPYNVSNVRLGPADTRRMAVEADPDPRRAVWATVRCGHSLDLIRGNDVKSAALAGCFE